MTIRPFARVLVATDLSRPASYAVDRAARLPLADGARLTLLHVLPADVPRPLALSASREVERRLARLVRAAARSARFGHAPRDLRVHTALATGRPWEEILRQAETEEAELVAVGKHGRRPLADLWLGSTAERLIRHGQIPVLVAKARPIAPFHRLLVALALADPGDRNVLEMGLRAAGPGATAAVVHVCVPPFAELAVSVTGKRLAAWRRRALADADRALGQMVAPYAGGPVRVEPLARSGDPRLAIAQEADKRGADLVVVGTRGRSAIQRAFVGSVAEGVIRATRCDVLVAR